MVATGSYQLMGLVRDGNANLLEGEAVRSQQDVWGVGWRWEAGVEAWAWVAEIGGEVCLSGQGAEFTLTSRCA